MLSIVPKAEKRYPRVNRIKGPNHVHGGFSMAVREHRALFGLVMMSAAYADAGQWPELCVMVDLVRCPWWLKICPGRFSPGDRWPW